MAFPLENRTPVLLHAQHPSVPVRGCAVPGRELALSVASEANLDFLLVIAVVLGMNVSMLLCAIDSVYWL